MADILEPKKSKSKQRCLPLKSTEIDRFLKSHNRPNTSLLCCSLHPSSIIKGPSHQSVSVASNRVASRAGIYWKNGFEIGATRCQILNAQNLIFSGAPQGKGREREGAGEGEGESEVEVGGREP